MRKVFILIPAVSLFLFVSSLPVRAEVKNEVDCSKVAQADGLKTEDSSKNKQTNEAKDKKQSAVNVH